MNGLGLVALLGCLLMGGQVRAIDIRWGPIPGSQQAAFFDDDTPDANLLFTGGWFSGKTMTLTGKALKLSAINNPIRGFWLVPDWNHVEDTIIPTLTDLDPETEEPWFLREDQFHYNLRTHVLTWDGGGPIQFMTAENFKSIAGPQGAWLAVDEPGSIRHEAWRNAVARVRHPRAKLRQKVASGTWEGLNWLSEMFGDPSRPEAYKVFTMKTIENTEGLRHNPAYIAQLKDNITEAEAASYLDAKISNLTGALAFPQFEEALHWRSDVPVEPLLPLRLTFDFNVNPMTLGIGQIVTGPTGPELRIIDWIAEYGGATVASCCKQLIARYPQGWAAGAVVYGDATGKSRHVKSLQSNYEIVKDTLQDWTVAGTRKPTALTFKVPTGNPQVAESLNATNRLLRDAHGRTRLWIRKTEPSRSCATRELVKSLQKTSKKSGTDDIEKKAGETHTHAGEALRYLVAVEFPIVHVRYAGAVR